MCQIKLCPINKHQQTSCEISGVLKRMTAKMSAYSTPMIAKHNRIQVGTRTTTQLQLINRSRRRAIKMNCRILTEQNSSSSKSRSFLRDQTETAIDRREMNTRGINASVQKKNRSDSSLSQTWFG